MTSKNVVPIKKNTYLKKVNPELLAIPKVMELSQAFAADGSVIQHGSPGDDDTTVGVYANKRLVLSPDLSHIYGLVGPRYQVIPHKNVLETVSGFMKSAPENAISLRQGAGMRALWDVKEWGDFEITKDDKAKPMLDVRNSVDGRGSFSVNLYAVRYACDNGMVFGQEIFGYSIPHFDSRMIEENMHNILDGAEVAFKQISRTFKAWDKIKVKQDQIESIAESICFGKKKLREIGDLEGKSAWTVYNAFTNRATHGSRNEAAVVNLSDRISRAFFNEFQIAA